MAFGISSVKIYPLEVEKSMRDQFVEVCEINLTAANTDTSLALATLAASDSDGAAFLQVLNNLDRYLSVSVAGLSLVSGAGDIFSLDSAASAGGAATETLTVTGLDADDDILSVSQFQKGANAAYIIDYGDGDGDAAADNALAIEWNTNPGAGAKVKVTARRAAAAQTPGIGEFKFDWSLTAPTFTFPGLTNTPTAMKMFLLCKLKSGAAPVRTSNA